ncbi:MAG: peptidylprolyl isomerase [Pseudomonadota bacterium]
MAKASARHILVDTEAACEDLKARIAGGEDFADLAQQHSSCPSGKNGGALGEFPPGMMVKEFDEVVFNEALGVVHGPVKTQFGYHLLEITARED